MATQYPSAIDTTGTLPYVINGVSYVLADDVNVLRDAIVSMETELGADPAGSVSTTVADRFDVIEAALVAFAPKNASYLVLDPNVTLSDERLFVAANGIESVDAGAGGNFVVGLSLTGVTAGAYNLANITIDGYGRISAATSTSSGETNKLAYWSDASTLTADGYIAVNGTGGVTIDNPQNSPTLFRIINDNGDVHSGAVFEASTATDYIRMAAYPDGYTGYTTPLPMAMNVIDSSTDLIINTRGEALYLFNNFGGLFGDNADAWAGFFIQDFGVMARNKLSQNVSSDASMYSNNYVMAVGGNLALGPPSADDGLGSSIEASDSLAIAAMGNELLLLSNFSTVSSESQVIIGGIDGNGPAANGGWAGRFDSGGGHVLPIGTFGYNPATPNSEGGDYFLTIGTTTTHHRALNVPGGISMGEALGSAIIGAGLNTAMTSGLGNVFFVADANNVTGTGFTGQISFGFGADTGSDGYTYSSMFPSNVADYPVLVLTDTAMTSNINIYAPTGSAASPSYSFPLRADDGMYSAGNDILGFATNGIADFFISLQYLYGAAANGAKILSSAGLVGTPTYSYVGDEDTGTYLSSANELSHVTNGVARQIVSNTAVRNIVELESAATFYAAGSKVRKGATQNVALSLTNDASLLRTLIAGTYEFECYFVTQPTVGGFGYRFAVSAGTMDIDAVHLLYVLTTSVPTYSVETGVAASTQLNTGSSANPITVLVKGTIKITADAVFSLQHVTADASTTVLRGGYLSAIRVTDGA